MLLALLLPAPAWAAAEHVPTWAAYALFVIVAAAVIAFLVREALFSEGQEEQPEHDRVRPITPPPRYDAGEAARKTAANRRVA